jgi:hypothetical protein
MPVAGIYTIWRMIGGARPARGIVVPFRRRPEPRDDTQLNAEWN